MLRNDHREMKIAPAKVGLLLAFVVWGGSASSAPTAWTTTGPPDNAGGVWALAVAPSRPTTVYAGTRDGVWKSLDGGHSWSPAGLVGFTIFSLTVDPTDPETVYAMAEENSYFDHGTLSKTIDGGSSWTGLVYLRKFESMTSIHVHPSRPSIVYAEYDSYFYTGYRLGIARSTDAFATFTIVAPALPGSVASFALDPRDPSVLYLLYGPGEFQSDDEGETWTEIGTGPGPGKASLLIPDPFVAGTLFAGGDSGLSLSEDGGRTWVATSFVGNVTAAVADPAHPGTIFVGTDGGVFVSSDRGGSWADISSTLPAGTLVTSLAIGNRTLHAGSFVAGVFEWTTPTRPVPVIPAQRTPAEGIRLRP